MTVYLVQFISLGDSDHVEAICKTLNAAKRKLWDLFAGDEGRFDSVDDVKVGTFYATDYKGSGLASEGYEIVEHELIDE